MSLLERVIIAHRCRSTHHYIAMDSLSLLSGEDAEKWRNLILVHNEEFLAGAKAPDKVFKDFKNHVLHVGEGEWGGARNAAMGWYAEAVDKLRAKKWGKAVYALGVLSHYYADPIQPFHTGQTEEEGAMHRAVEWSIAKSRPTLKALIDERGYPEVEADNSIGFVSNMVRAGADKSHQYYQTVLDHYNLDVGAKHPEAGLDQTLIDVFAELIAYATSGLAVLFSRAVAEAGVKAPKVHISVPGYLATLDIPIRWITKKLDNAADQRTVSAMYREYKKTGKVIKTLSDDDKRIRRMHAKQVLRLPIEKLDAQELRPIGQAFVAREAYANIVDEIMQELEPETDEEIAAEEEAAIVKPAKAKIPAKAKQTVGVAALVSENVEVEDQQAQSKAKYKAKVKAKAKAKAKAIEEEKAAEKARLEEAREAAEREARFVEERQAREEADRLEREERERLEAEETERLRREEADRLEREELERLEAEETARLQREEADRLEREEPERLEAEEAERLQREEADRLEREERERLEAEETERLRREEADRIEREERERLEAEEAERLRLEETEAESEAEEEYEFSLEELAAFDQNLTENGDLPVSEVVPAEQAAPPVESFFDAPSDGSGQSRDARTRLRSDDPVVDAPSIGKKTARRLNRVGIFNVEDLLNCDSEEIAFELDVRHIDEPTLEDWKAQCRLMMDVPGLRGHDAQVLVGAGIRSAEDLATAPATRVFHAAMGFLKSSEGSRYVRGDEELEQGEVQNWIELATEASAA